MSSEKLIHMANQIAGFFRSYPEEQAISGIHDHLAAFWTPHMRDAIMSCAWEEGNGIDPLVLLALRTFPTAKGSVEKPVAGPSQPDPQGQDAG